MSFPIPIPPQIKKRVEIPRANLGMYLDRPYSEIPAGGLSTSLNVRIKDGWIRNDNLGWSLFHSANDQTNPWTFAMDILLIDRFKQRSGTELLMVGTKSDLMYWNGSNDFLFITPIYTPTGTGCTYSDASTTVTGIGGTTWDADGVKAGDWMHLGTASKRNLGVATVDDPADNWAKIADVVSDTEITLENALPVNGTNQPYTIRLSFTGADDDYWSSDTFPDAPGSVDLWFAANGNEFVSWDGTAAEVVLRHGAGAMDIQPRIILYHKNMLLLGNITIPSTGESYPTNIRNSAIGDPTDVALLDSSEFNIADKSDVLLAMEPLGDIVACYCEESVSVIQHVGPPLMFLIRTALPDRGIQGGRMVTSFDTYHEFLSVDRALRFDGVSSIEYGDHVFREVLKQFDRNRSQRGLLIHDYNEGEIQWCVPRSSDDTGETGNVTKSLSEHYRETVSKRPVPILERDLPATASGTFLDSGTRLFSGMTDPFDSYTFAWNDRVFTTSQAIVLFGDNSGNIWKLNSSSLMDGVSYGSQCVFPNFPAWDGFNKGIVSSVEAYTEPREGASYPLACTIVPTDHKSSFDYSDAETILFDLSHETNRIEGCRSVGLEVSFVFSTNLFINNPTSAQVFALQGFAFVTGQAGQR